MKGIMLFIFALGFMNISCSSPSTDNSGDPTVIPPGPGPEPAKTNVLFVPTVNAFSRATNTAFDSSDEISVFAVRINTNNPIGVLAASENYVNNARYVYRSGKFEAFGDAISFPDNNTTLAFHAVYPFLSVIPVPEFNFSVQRDQGNGVNHSQSDLMTAFNKSGENVSVPLNFYHRLSRLIVNFTLEGFTGGNISFTLSNVLLTAKVNLNNTTFEGHGSKEALIPDPNGNLSYKAILPPQALLKGTELGALVIDGEKYIWNLSDDLVLKSGVEYIYELKATKEESKVVQISSSINPWEK